MMIGSIPAHYGYLTLGLRIKQSSIPRLAARYFLTWLTVLLAAVIPAVAQQSQTSSTPVQYGGTLSYTITETNTGIPCPSNSSLLTNAWTFSNFVYTDVFGNNVSMFGSATTFWGPSGNCNISPAPSTDLTGGGYDVSFTAQYADQDNSTAVLVPVFGAIFPKYQVVAVDYAPPGAKSTVAYQDGFVQGSNQTNTSTFSNAYSFSVKLDFGGPIGRFVGTSLQASVGGSYSDEEDHSTQNAVNVTTTQGSTIPGPVSSAAGIDHDNDVIWVWLNPGVSVSVLGQDSITWHGFGYNDQDPLHEVDVVFLYVGWLKNPSSIPANIASRLARTWDTSGIGGLTAADYQSILAADPFVTNPQYNPNTDSTGRFTMEGGQNFNYETALVGTQPVPQSFTFTAQNIVSSTNTSKDTRSVSASVTANLGAFVFVNSVMGGYTYTSSSSWTSVTTDTTNQQVTITIVPPASTDNYTGPTAIQCWRDNIYGSYMFYAVE